MSEREQPEPTLHPEWGVRYETPNPEPLHDPTITMRVASESIARDCVKNGAPINAANRRVVRRYVTDWEETP